MSYDAKSNHLIYTRVDLAAEVTGIESNTLTLGTAPTPNPSFGSVSKPSPTPAQDRAEGVV